MRTQESKCSERLVLVQDRACEYETASAECLLSWREEAMNDALRGFYNGEYADALLYAIRRYNPDLATLQIQPNSERLQMFLKEKCKGVRSLLGNSHRQSIHGSTGYREYIGWYSVDFEGETIEAAIAPCSYRCQEVILVGSQEDTLTRFANELKEYTNKPSGRSMRYAHGWENAPEVDKELGKVTWSDIVLPKEKMDGIRTAVEGFAQSRSAYERFGFAWRRGILLIGPPGTGKTMICKAAAAAIPEFPFLYVRDLHDYEGTEAIQSIFQQARDLAPCILAIEDLDGLVQDGNRTVFLNEMDGFNNNNGLLVIASSNYPEKIDEALLRRPSRFDQVFHFGLPAKPERLEYCRRIMLRPELSEHLSEDLDIEQLVTKVAEKAEGFTPAYLKEAFISAALIRAQQGAMLLDSEYADTVLQQLEELKKHLKRTRNPQDLAEMETGAGVMGFRR